MALLAGITLVLATGILAAGCGDSEAEEAPSVTASPTSSATGTPSPDGTSTRSLASVEEIDFTDAAVIGPIIDHFGGGEIEPQRLEYIDITHDGALEAFVVVESGGTAGDLGAALVGVEDGMPHVLGYVDAGGRVELRFPEVGGGVVVTTEGIWEPGDALCCPSGLHERTWEWRDDDFVLVNEQFVDNPDVEPGG